MDRWPRYRDCEYFRICLCSTPRPMRDGETDVDICDRCNSFITQTCECKSSILQTDTSLKLCIKCYSKNMIDHHSLAIEKVFSSIQTPEPTQKEEIEYRGNRITLKVPDRVCIYRSCNRCFVSFPQTYFEKYSTSIFPFYTHLQIFNRRLCVRCIIDDLIDQELEVWKLWEKERELLQTEERSVSDNWMYLRYLQSDDLKSSDCCRYSSYLQWLPEEVLIDVLELGAHSTSPYSTNR
jgi:hypothetical protein